MRRMYDLAGADAARRFSPYCWRTKLALAHKGLDVETIPWRFTERNVLAFSGSERVPVMIDGETVVFNSWTIANYLEDTYADTPSLFGGETGRATAHFVNSWCDLTLGAPMSRILLADILERIAEKDRDYFRSSREKRFGMTFDEIVSNPPARIAAFRQVLEPVRLTLRTQPYLSGATPLYPDYILFGHFMWARCTSPAALLEPDDPVYQWRERMLDALGGMGRKAYGAYAA